MGDPQVISGKSGKILGHKDLDPSQQNPGKHPPKLRPVQAASRPPLVLIDLYSGVPDQSALSEILFQQFPLMKDTLPLLHLLLLGSSDI